MDCGLLRKTRSSIISATGVCVCVRACLGVVVWWHQRVPGSNILYKSRSAGERGKRDERGYPGGVHTRDFTGKNFFNFLKNIKNSKLVERAYIKL